VPELEQADLDAILTVRAALGDEAPTRPAPPAGLRLVEAA
jgi:hypothetical protein